MKIAGWMTCILLAAGVCAQEQPVAKRIGSYRVDFAVHESEQGKRVSTHNYSLLIHDGGSGRIRMGNKVPVTSGSGIQFVDIGLNLDCRVHERDAQVTLDADVSMSGVDADQQGKAAGPVIRQVQSSTMAAVTPGKPTTILTMDDPAAKRRYEIEVTATKVQ